MCSVIGGCVVDVESQKTGIVSQHFVEQDGIAFVIQYLRIGLILTIGWLGAIWAKSSVVFIWPRAVRSRLRDGNVVKQIRHNARNLIDGRVNGAHTSHLRIPRGRP